MQFPICLTLVALLTTQSWWCNVLASFRCWGSPDDVAAFPSNFDVKSVAVPIYHTGDSLILSLPLLAKLIPSAQHPWALMSTQSQWCPVLAHALCQRLPGMPPL